MTMNNLRKRKALDLIGDAIHGDHSIEFEFGPVGVESNDEEVVVSFFDDDGDVETRLVLSASVVDARYTKVRSR